MPSPPDLICLARQRWDFVYQRPNHLMTRFAHHRRVFFVEEPVYDAGPARLVFEPISSRLTVVEPHLPRPTSPEEAVVLQRRLLNGLVADERLVDPVLWFYAPTALPLTADLHPSLIVYDCVQELSACGAAPVVIEDERRLLASADLVFTSGQSLYEAKSRQHRSVHAFPSSVDAQHFSRARRPVAELIDQVDIPRPRIGYFGLIDERMDLALLARAATERPAHQFVMVGPIVGIDPAGLPRRDNIHWLGQQNYADLPRYLAGWDVAMIPFALNDSTRFISPTKTLEYLAAGRPIVSTAIQDVVVPFGERGLVHIADAAGFARAIDDAMAENTEEHRRRADLVLHSTSWNRTFERMCTLMDAALAGRRDAGARHVA